MIIAQKKRKENIAEYLLYMWQVEDLIRAAGVSLRREQLLLPRYDVDEEKRAEIRSWYLELIEMMRTEGKVESGHLDVNRIVLMQLEELHRRLISNPNDIVYSGLHLQILPALIQLRGKNNGAVESDLETCFNALYGYITPQPPAQGGQRGDQEVNEADQRLPRYACPPLQDGARGHRGQRHYS